jgi:predicted DNA-binding protein (UPF0251 family)
MRPRKKRFILDRPIYNLFKPAGVRARELEQIILLVEEYEAIRLADYENMKHVDAAELMEISRPTFSRLIDSARKKIAIMIMEGKAISIEGGDFHIKRGGTDV